MSSLLVIHNSVPTTSSRDEVLSQLDDWSIYYVNIDHSGLSEVHKIMRNHQTHFLLVEKAICPETINTLSQLRKQYPLIKIIYYNSQLKDVEFAQLYMAGIDYCFIGDARQVNLLKTLRELWASHWRRIPQDLLFKSDYPQDARAVKICRKIETAPIPKLTSADMAQAIKISESQFRLVFKKLFRTNFRDFKQKLLFNYESILLFEKKLKPREVFDILNYKNLSAFSRSFKSRHGRSWQEIIRETAQ